MIALAVVALAWLSTLQVTIGAANDPFLHPSGLVDPLMDDSGEFVVAWHTWGVTHPPGYPLLNAVGNAIVRLFGFLGLGGVASASLVSLLCAVAALAVLAWLVGQAGGSGWGPAAAVLLAGFGLLTWLYASVAEAYALGLLLGFGMVALAWALGERPSARQALALGLVVGLAAGHHRTLLALLPAVALAAWPAWRLGWRVWLGAAGLAVASLAVYAYLPLAAWSGSPWVYGRSPATWAGLLDAVLAREYGTQLAPPTTLAAIGEALVGRFAFALEENALAVRLGTIGLAFALAMPRTRRLAAVLGLVVAGYFLAPVGQYLVVGTHMLLMVATVALAGAAGLGVAAVELRWPAWVRAGPILTAAVALATLRTFAMHRDRVMTYTRDPSGERLIVGAAALDEPQPTLVEAWGPRYFALAYGKYGDGRLAEARLVDARADLSGLPAAAELPATLYAPQDFLYLAGPERWAEHFGAPAALGAVEDGLVAVRQAPVVDPPPLSSPLARTDAGDVALVDARAWREGGELRVRLTWRAERRPAQDYAVFVKAFDGAPGQAAEPLAQADRESPVFGFYPTSRWRADELVMDDGYRLRGAELADADTVSVGLYSRAPGGFVDHLRHDIPIEPTD